LLKLLLKKYFKVNPIYFEAGVHPTLFEYDAQLIIGNDAMTSSNELVSYSYDLSALWQNRTGRSTIFMVFAVRSSSMDLYEDKFKQILNVFNKSLSYLENDIDYVIDKALEKYKKPNYDLKLYLRNIQFRLTSKLKDDLMYFYNEAYEAGLLKPVKEIRFLEFTKNTG